MDNGERAKVLDKKNKEGKFRWRKNMKIGGEKMRNASGQQGENEKQWKKANRNTSNKTFGVHKHVQHFLHKMCY